MTLALEHARNHGATLAAADVDRCNLASQRVLTKCGLVEVARRDALVFYEQSL